MSYDKEVYRRRMRAAGAWKASETRYNQTPRHKFSKQRCHARERGIEWTLTFDQWWARWKDFWQLRGRGKDSLVMCRYEDVGPYSDGNVYIWSAAANIREGLKVRKSRHGY